MLKTQPERALAKPCLEVTFNEEPLVLRFSQPMIAIGSQQLPNITLAPPVEGKWRWFDQYTLYFENTQDFPRATHYTVALPEGVRSLEGATCPPRFWTATHKGPVLRNVHPYPGQKLVLQPVFSLRFDQKIDPEAIAPMLRLRAGKMRFELRVLERTDDNEMIVQPVRELPRDTAITLELPPGLPSLEGPLVSEKGKRLEYRTFPPLRMVRRGLLEWLSSPDPDEPLRIRFNNPLKAGTARVRLEPELDVVVAVDGCELTVSGPRVAGQAYKVHVDPMLTDVFGQQLGRAERRSFRPCWVRRNLALPEMMVAVRPGEQVPLFTSGLKHVNCTLKSVDLDQWEQYRQGNPIKTRPLKTWTHTVPNWASLGTTWLDVGPDVGHRVLEVWSGHLVAVLWLQVTELNLQTSAYPEGLSVVVTGAEGRPREGASVTWGSSQGRTGWDGHCLLERPEVASMVKARVGRDSAFMEVGVPWPRQTDTLRWCVFDDRGLYRPGETARLKGWVRRHSGGVPTGLLDYRLRGPKSEETGQVLLSAQGGFDLELVLHGYSQLELTLDGSTHTHFLRVEEFRRPEFELELQTLPEGPRSSLDPPLLRLTAAYHSGGPLGGAPVEWKHRLHEISWIPPELESFFPWKLLEKPVNEYRSDSTQLDEQGLGTVMLPPARPRCGAAMRVMTSVSVTDQSRQVVTQHLETVVVNPHPMVGLRWSGASAELIVVDPLGGLLAGRAVEVRSGEKLWEIVSQEQPVRFEVTGNEPLTARLGEHVQCLRRPVRSDPFGLVLPDDPVQPGDEVALEVACEERFRLGVLRVWIGPRRLLVRVFRPDEPLTLKVPEGPRASIELELSVLMENGGWRSRTQLLPVSLSARVLEVSVKASPDVVRPGTPVRVAVEVLDAEGRPVPDAEVALLGVDESVLQIAHYRSPDLLGAIYPHQRSESRHLSLDCFFPRNYTPRRSDSVCYCLSGSGGSGSGPEAIALREDLRPLAFFYPALKTDAAGRVELEAPLPDSLTRFRVTALATSGGSFGSAATRVSTRLPLALRPWLPRFLHQGDRFDFCLGVQNLTAEEREVRVEATVSGLRFLDGVERTCTIKPGARVEVRFPCVAEQSGPAVGLARAVSGELEDACRIRLPVKVPRFPERVTHQGRAGRSLSVAVPPSVEPDYGGLELVECDSPLPLTNDAYEALRRYSMSCSEQLSSRLLGWVLGGPHFAPGDWRSQASGIVKRLLERQQVDGRFWLYPGHDHDYPFVTVHAVQALLRAYTAGIELDLQRLSRGMDALAALKGTPNEEAYALNVLSQVGRSDPDRVEELAGHRRLTCEGMAWLLPLARGRTRAKLREKMLDGLEKPAYQGLFFAPRRPAALAYMALGDESAQLERLLEPNPYGTTQDHAFTLLALASEGTGAQWTRRLSVPELLESPEVCLREGPYFRATLTTMPREVRHEAVNNGFSVTRTYEVDDLVRIKLVITTSGARQMVGVIDPLPAGLELLPRAEQRLRAIHAEFRDDCTELFFSHMDRGRHEITLLARATTPGRFLAPGTRVEEMYRPQVHGVGEAQELTL